MCKDFSKLTKDDFVEIGSKKKGLPLCDICFLAFDDYETEEPYCIRCGRMLKMCGPYGNEHPSAPGFAPCPDHKNADAVYYVLANWQTTKTVCIMPRPGKSDIGLSKELQICDDCYQQEVFKSIAKR